MLVLSRKVGERVVIGDNIVVTVLEVKGRQVRLGFEAPPDIQIWRGEIARHRWMMRGYALGTGREDAGADPRIRRGRLRPAG